MRDPRWYGSDPSWYVPFDRDAFRLFGRRLTVEQGWIELGHADPSVRILSCGVSTGSTLGAARVAGMPTRLYRLDGVDVVGRQRRTPATIEFRPQRYFPGGLPRDGRDFPIVHAGEMKDSPHRYEDGSLCLYHPDDPAEKRWTSQNSFAELIVLVQDHLFLEDTFADTGEWIAPQAPHGFTKDSRRAA